MAVWSTEGAPTITANIMGTQRTQKTRLTDVGVYSATFKVPHSRLLPVSLRLDNGPVTEDLVVVHHADHRVSWILDERGDFLRSSSPISPAPNGHPGGHGPRWRCALDHPGGVVPRQRAPRAGRTCAELAGPGARVVAVLVGLVRGLDPGPLAYRTTPWWWTSFPTPRARCGSSGRPPACSPPLIR